MEFSEVEEMRAGSSALSPKGLLASRWHRQNVPEDFISVNFSPSV